MTIRTLTGALLGAAALVVATAGPASADKAVVYQHMEFSGYSAEWTYWAGSGINDLSGHRLYGPRTSMAADNEISSVKNLGNRYYSLFTGTYQTGSRLVLPPWTQSRLVPHNDQYSSTWAG